MKRAESQLRFATWRSHARFLDITPADFGIKKQSDRSLPREFNIAAGLESPTLFPILRPTYGGLIHYGPVHGGVVVGNINKKRKVYYEPSNEEYCSSE